MGGHTLFFNVIGTHLAVDSMNVDREALSACLPRGRAPTWAANGKTIWIDTKCIVCKNYIKATKDGKVNGACKTAVQAEEALWVAIAAKHGDCTGTCELAMRATRSVVEDSVVEPSPTSVSVDATVVVIDDVGGGVLDMRPVDPGERTTSNTDDTGFFF